MRNRIIWPFRWISGLSLLMAAMPIIFIGLFFESILNLLLGRKNDKKTRDKKM